MSHEFRGTDRFQVIRRLGEGGFGVVYEAFDRDRGMRVALKTLTRVDGPGLYRLKKEFRVLADVAHENLAQLYELVSAGDEWFFTMELVDGTDWLGYVRETELGLAAEPHAGPTRPLAKTVEADELAGLQGKTADALDAAQGINLRRLRDSLDQLARGLHALHDAGIVHRDVKPSNVLVTRQGRVVILDFGIAARLARHGVQSTGEAFVGTPAYMAPEQATDAEPTPAADWYAVGIMIFEAITGGFPFDGAPLRIVMDKQRLEPPRLRAVRPDAPPDLEALCADLLRVEATLRPSSEQILQRLGLLEAAPLAPRASSGSSGVRGAATSLSGRGVAFAALEEEFQAVRGGASATVLVHGASGMGKSTLVRMFLDQQRAQDSAIVLSGRCYERESVPYKAFDSIIDALSRYLLALRREEAALVMPRDAAALATIFPVLGQVPAVAGAPRRANVQNDAQQLRARAFAALRELVLRLGDRKPVVLFIDDVQWGDADSAPLLVELTLPPDPPSLLLILAYRTDDAGKSPLLQSLEGLPLTGSARRCRTIALEPLSPDEAEALAVELLGEDAPAPGIAAEIAAESGGNPYFLSELVHAAAQGTIHDASGPLRLEELIRQRVFVLPAGARALLEIVCVAERPIHRDAAVRVAEMSAEESARFFAILRVGRFIRTAGGRTEAWIEPYHDRIRETITSSLRKGERRHLHRQLMTALAATGTDDPEMLFLHARGAGLDEEAARYAKEAAEKARAMLAFDRAASFCRDALALLPQGSGETRRLRILLGDALANAGRGADAAAAYLAAVPDAEPALRLELHRRAAEQLLFSGHINAGLDAIRSVLAHVGMTLTTGRVVVLVWLLFYRLCLAVRGLSFRAREEAGIPATELLRVDVCWSVATGIALLDTIQGAVFGARVLLMSLRAGEPRRVVRALCVEAIYIACDGVRARKRALRVLELARSSMGGDDQKDFIEGAAGMVDLLTGHDLVEAQEHLDRSMQMALERGRTVWERNNVQLFSIFALVHRGDLRELERRMPACLQDAADRGDVFFATNLRLAEPNIWWLVHDDPATARAVVEDALGHWSHRTFHMQHWYELQALSNIDLYEGNTAVARERVEQRWHALGRSLLLRIQSSRIAALDVRARCAAACGARADGASHRAAAARYARRLVGEGQLWSTGVGRVVLAAVALQRGDADLARTELDRAVSTFVDARMALHEAAARRRLGELLGGDEGGRLVADANDWMRTHGVKDPDRMTGMLAPGFAGARRRAAD